MLIHAHTHIHTCTHVQVHLSKVRVAGREHSVEDRGSVHASSREFTAEHEPRYEHLHLTG